MKKLLLASLVIGHFATFAQSTYECFQRGSIHKVGLVIKSENSFELKTKDATIIFVKTDNLIDFANNNFEVIYKSESKRWVRNEYTGLKMWTHFKTDFTFNKETKEGTYNRYSKIGLLSRADKDKISFKCK